MRCGRCILNYLHGGYRELAPAARQPPPRRRRWWDMGNCPHVRNNISARVSGFTHYSANARVRRCKWLHMLYVSVRGNAEVEDKEKAVPVI